MILIGLTGGIASGKSTVARLLEKKGAAIIDADVLGHQVLEPGGPPYEKVVERFGDVVLTPDGRIDRTKLGEIVFGDPQARADLNAITHPEIYRAIVKSIEDFRTTGRVVVLDVALLVETLTDRGKRLGLKALVVVAANPSEQIERLARDRKMTTEQATARIRAQAPNASKMAAADYVIDNRGTFENLERSVDALWDLLTGMPS